MIFVPTRGEQLASTLVVGSFAAAAVAVFWLWLSANPTEDFVLSVPGTDGRPQASTDDVGRVLIGEHFRASDGVPADLPGSWPRFRGPSFDNKSPDTVVPAGSFGESEPRVLWKVALGEGHAGAAVDRGRVYVLDYDEELSADMLRCLSLADGREIWRRWYGVRIKRNHGMSRTVPAVADGYVVTIGPKCHVMCVDAETGDLLWGIDLERELGAEVPLWYTGQCPLIDDGLAVLAVGGTELLLGVDCATGNVIWRTPNPDGYSMSHSSIMLMDILGKRSYVYCALGAVVGVSAEKEDRGALLWTNTDFDATVIAPSPVQIDSDRVFVTAGYGAGSMLLRIERDGDSFAAETVYQTRPKEGFSCEQQTPLVHNGLLFGILTKDAGPLRNQFVCYDPSGTMVWTSGETNRFGLGPYAIAGDRILILDDSGMLTVADLKATEYRPLGQMRILDGLDAWGPLAFAGRLLIARDSKTMVCIDLGRERGIQ